MKNNIVSMLICLLLAVLFCTACSADTASKEALDCSNGAEALNPKKECEPAVPADFTFLDSQKTELPLEQVLNHPAEVPESKKLSFEEIEKMISEKSLIHYFQNSAGKQLYEMNLNYQDKTIQWDYGWFESEYEAHYSGNYAENNGSFDCTFSETKREGGVMTQKSEPVHMAFEVFVPTKKLSKSKFDVVISITETDIPALSELIHQPLVFSSENPEPYPARNVQFIFRYTNGTDEKQILILADEQAILNGDAVELETQSKIHFLMSKTDDQTLFKDGFKENPDLNGETESKIPYRVFVRDTECGENIWRREYCVFFKTAENFCFQAVLTGQEQSAKSSEDENFRFGSLEEYKKDFYPILQTVKAS